MNLRCDFLSDTTVLFSRTTERRKEQPSSKFSVASARSLSTNVSVVVILH